MTLIPYLQTIAKGAERGRSLTMAEAQCAMDAILDGSAAPETLGAFLMVLRFRGETHEEIAGFTAALRARTAWMHGRYDLDWPCYAAGRTRGAPLFLLAAKLVAQAGFRVALHGWNSHQSSGASVRAVLGPLTIAQNDPDAALCYFPLETLSPRAFDLLALRDTFGLRSCINTVLRMWNPANAPVSLQGVFHPSYRGLQTRAAEALGQTALTVIKGGGGEFERNPSKTTEVFGLRGGVAIQDQAPAIWNAARKLHDPDAAVDAVALWAGQSSDPFAIATVTATTALALWSLHAAPNLNAAQTQANALWAARHHSESFAL